jgi:hypothetical protein
MECFTASRNGMAGRISLVSGRYKTALQPVTQNKCPVSLLTLPPLRGGTIHL